MSQETFDPITRSIRSVETDARLVIATAETAVASMRKKRNVTVASYREIFDKLGACLAEANQTYDSVVAHSHLVADNIALRSKRNVLNVRQNLLETANQMLDHCRPSLFPGVYDPSTAFAAITDSLKKHGLYTGEPDVQEVALATNVVAKIATYQLTNYTFSVIVTISCPDMRNLGEGSDKISVSVWEDRMPPIWDSSYHDAQGEILKVDAPQGKNIGRWTRQTDAALADYVASVLSRDVTIRTNDNMAAVPTDPREPTNRYGTSIGRPLRKGSDQFDYEADADILSNAITGFAVGEQGELLINLNPQVVSKVTMARYILQIIQQYDAKTLEARTRLNRDGYYQIIVIGNAECERVKTILDKVLG